MAEESSSGAVRLMNFVSEEKLEEAKRSRGERVEDGTAQRDRPLFEILKDNKDKKDAEFNERFKHRPPKALDQDESDFLDNLEQSRRDYEQQLAQDEAQQLRKFQAAQFTVDQDLTPPPPQQLQAVPKPNKPRRPVPMIIAVKKPKLDLPHSISTANPALVSYSDDSDEDDS